MKLAAMFGSSSGAIGATAVGAVIVVAGAVGYSVFTAEPEVEGTPPVAVAEPDVTPAATPDPVEEIAVAQSPEPVADPAPLVTVEAPRLDLVRVDADGSTVIAGRTAPNLPIAILLDGEEIATAQADGAGDFVSLLSLNPSDAPRVLSVEARPEEGEAIEGVETILVAPFAGPPTEVAEADVDAAPSQETAPQAPTEEAQEFAALLDNAPDPEPEVAPEAEPVAAPAEAPDEPISQPVDIAGADAPAVIVPSVAPGVLATAPGSPTVPNVTVSEIALNGSPNDTAPQAAPPPARANVPAVVIASPEGLRVIQGTPEEPAVQTSVQFDAISYNAQGAVILAGRGSVAADIQVYLNNQPIQLGEVGAGGAWSLQLPDVDPGTYTLAVAELAADGSTTSRVETPFLREDPERVAEAPVAEADGIDVITVQPGFTLWGMAENTFGDGILYVQIFEENQDQIRDPDWIFPGQIFRLPDIGTENDGN